MAEGEFALARHHLEEGLARTGEWVGDHDLYAMLADAAAQQRDEIALKEYAPQAEETALRYDHVLFQAIADRAFGVVHTLAGDYAKAEEHFKWALKLFRELDTRWQIGRTLFELGELARVQTNTVVARDYYSDALEEFEKLDAIPDMARTRATLESLNGQPLD